MNDATTIMSEESSLTICLITPLQAQLIQDTKDSIGVSSIVQEIKQAINGDLSKRYISDQERNTLFTTFALDLQFKGLAFLSEEEQVEAEATSLEVISPFYFM